MTAPNSRKFPELYKKLDINMAELGCIMYDIEPFEVVKFVEGGEDDLYFSDPNRTPDFKFAQGAVAESNAHVTLLFGLLELGPVWKNYVDAVLDGWSMDSVRISSVGYFPSSVEGEDYSVIVGHIELTPELVEGHERLQLLPHIDTFPGYKPHITLAYVKNGPSGVEWTDSTRDKWVESLNKEFAGKSFPVSQINYGAEK